MVPGYLDSDNFAKLLSEVGGAGVAYKHLSRSSMRVRGCGGPVSACWEHGQGNFLDQRTMVNQNGKSYEKTFAGTGKVVGKGFRVEKQKAG